MFASVRELEQSHPNHNTGPRDQHQLLKYKKRLVLFTRIGKYNYSPDSRIKIKQIMQIKNNHNKLRKIQISEYDNL